MKNILLLTTILSLVGCGGGSSSESTPTPTPAPAPTPAPVVDDLVGIWQHAQLSSVLDIRQDSYTLYQTAGDYCLVASEQSRTRLTDDLGSYALSDDKTRINIDLEDDFEAMFYQESDTLPIACSTPIVPVENARPSLVFESFWHQFNESYASFDVRGVNWEQTYSEYVAKFTDDLTTEQVESLLSEMLKSLGDAHAGVITSDNGVIRSINYSPLQSRLALEAGLSLSTSDWLTSVNDKLSEAGANIVQGYLDNGEMLESDQVIWGQLDNGFGYLNLRSMNFDGDEDTANIIAAKNIVQALASRLADMTSLVIDLRFNQGGNVPAALMLADFLANTSGAAFDITYHNVNKQAYTYNFSVSPSGDGFTGSVYVLVSQNTGSAAEAFIHGIKVGNQARLIGENSWGIQSGPTPRVLANGWIAMVPNRVVTSPDGISYEKVGFSPDIVLEAFNIEDIDAGIDGVLDYINRL